MNRILRAPLALLAGVVLVSCVPDVTGNDEFGNPGDGLEISIDENSLATPPLAGVRSIKYTLSGYVPESVRVEVYGPGSKTCSVTADSRTTGVISVSKLAKDTVAIQLFALNGRDVVLKSVLLEGKVARVDDDNTFFVPAEGGDATLSAPKGESFTVSVSQNAGSWLSADGTTVSALKNESGAVRTAPVTVSHNATGCTFTYTITQKRYVAPVVEEPDDSEEKRYKERYDYYSKLASEIDPETSSYSDKTPMGQHYEAAALKQGAATEEQKAWLADPENEPDILNSIEGGTLRPYTVTLYPSGEPKPSDVNQHDVPDCCALAVFAEMAYVCPDFIKHIITDNGDGTFTLIMHDLMGNPINVGLKSTFIGTEKTIKQVTGKDKVPTWATLMEKGVMKWNKVFNVDKLGGIGPVAVAALYTGTGESFGYKQGTLSASQMAEMVDVMLHERMIIEGGFSQKGLAIEDFTTFTNHAWSVMYPNYDGYLFVMRNPWGHNDGLKNKPGDGVVNVPDDGVIQPVINMRVMLPGDSLPYAVKELGPYFPN